MNHLYRDLAPITDGAWGEIDTSAKGRLVTYLAARRLVDFHGPRGWDFSALNVGRTTPVIVGAPQGVEVHSRQVLPLIEYRVPFTLDRAELDAYERGATDIKLDALDGAVETIALAENVAVFHGFGAGGITGIVEASSHEPITMADSCADYPNQVARAVRVLLESGIGGPFALALSSDIWTTVVESSEHGGYPLFEHLRKAIVGGPIVWSPGLQGGLVLSQRGGDFHFESGSDLSIGYLEHSRSDVTLYLEESFTFKVDEPDAAVLLAVS
jgi:uncharacterized linocin/CFP29 family protein